MFETQIIMPDSQEAVENICRKLWMDNFSDTQCINVTPEPIPYKNKQKRNNTLLYSWGMYI